MYNNMFQVYNRGGPHFLKALLHLQLLSNHSGISCARKHSLWSSHHRAAETNPTRDHEASLRGLRIWHCRALWCRSQARLGSRVAVAVVEAGSCSSNKTPRLGTSICCGYSPRKDKRPKKTQKTKTHILVTSWSVPSILCLLILSPHPVLPLPPRERLLCSLHLRTCFRSVRHICFVIF